MKEDTRERFTLRLPSALFQLLKTEADKIGVSVNACILKILWDWAENNDDSAWEECSNDQSGFCSERRCIH